MVRSVNVKKTKSSKKIVLKITMSMTVCYHEQPWKLVLKKLGVRQAGEEMVVRTM